MILELLQKVCRQLDENGIKYMVSGSIALNIYGIPRMTRDIDIVIELSENRIDEFVNLFPNSYIDKNAIRDAIKRQGMFNIIDHSTGFKIDFMIRKETEYFNFAFQRRKRIKELDTELWVIDIDDLIIAKIIWIQQSQSEKQMLDIENLLFNPEKNIDYIISWCNKLNLQTFKLLDNE
jgi:hypothetical protein